MKYIVITFAAILLLASIKTCKRTEDMQYEGNIYWSSKIDSIESANKVALDSLKMLSKTQIEVRYMSVPKYVFNTDTILTPLDTCKQTVVYYYTKVKGKENLISQFEVMDSIKTIHIENITNVNKELDKKYSKQLKRKKRWRRISFILGAALTYSITKK